LVLGAQDAEMELVFAPVLSLIMVPPETDTAS
jgi:hypothetical protein